MAENNILEDLKTALKTFKDSADKELEEVRKQKESVRDMMSALLDASTGVHYVRESGTLVLSAPNIVIGNVDPNGHLVSGGGSKVTIRTNDLALEASGSKEYGGSITSRAASIRNIAVDPGPEGLENIVCEKRSEITNQAQCIAVNSAPDKGTFVSSASAVSPGVFITSETCISMNALPSAEIKSKNIESAKSAIESSIGSLESEISEQNTAIEKVLKDLEDPIRDQNDYNDSELDIAVFYDDMREIQAKFESLKTLLSNSVKSYVYNVSRLAEMNRRKKDLDAMKSELSSKQEKFKTEVTGGRISMATELFDMTSIDGDGNIRENKEAGLRIQVPHLSITAADAKGALIKDSTIDIQTQDFTLNTADAKPDEKRENGDYPATGSVKITTKEVLVQAIDEELKDKKMEEKALTAGGKITLRAESIAALATDKEGKSTGTLNLDAKKMTIAAMDVDPKTLEAKEMAAESQLNIQAEKTFVGTTEKAKLVQLASEKVGIMAKDTAEMQQDGKAVITLSGGNMDAGGSAVNLAGDTTIKGNADIKGEAKAPKGTFDQVEASQAFKSPNIDDTLGAGAPAPAEKPSAKMQEEKAQ